MVIACPGCGTKFNLPDEHVEPGVQLRCSVCQRVFPVPGESAKVDVENDEEAAVSSSDTTLSLEKKKEKGPKKNKGKLVIGLLIVLLLCAGGAVFLLGGISGLNEKIRELNPFSSSQTELSASTDMVSKISLRGVRQYRRKNEKFGDLIVIDGKAVNGFDEPREMIRVEATLFDKDGNALDTKQQIAGTSVSLFQLEVLGEKELEQALNNRIEILSNNTNVLKDTEVPFMIVFYNPSDTAAEFSVSVIDAKEPPKK